MMNERKGVANAAAPGQMARAVGGAYRPGKFRREALDFFRQRVGEKKFEQIMDRDDSFQHLYVAARVFLSPMDWVRYVWIEQRGTLEGFL